MADQQKKSFMGMPVSQDSSLSARPIVLFSWLRTINSLLFRVLSNAKPSFFVSIGVKSDWYGNTI